MRLRNLFSTSTEKFDAVLLDFATSHGNPDQAQALRNEINDLGRGLIWREKHYKKLFDSISQAQILCPDAARLSAELFLKGKFGLPVEFRADLQKLKLSIERAGVHVQVLAPSGESVFPKI